MKPSQREHPEAVAEFDAAVGWYEEQESGVGLRFIDRTAEARKSISQWPSAAPSLMIGEDGTVIRSKNVRGYPYRVVYSIEHDSSIFILAYAHQRRRPSYWHDRVET